MHHPPTEAIHDTILESPHKYNHIYHVLDAADFPLSLVPRIHSMLSLTPQRSHNRRSKTFMFRKDRNNEMSFIITRADLLAPRKEQVDNMMPYLIEVLRNALGRAGENVRLGNVRCVSAKRGWWTRRLKEDIWNRGGGGWMVGKVNVGKSKLFETVFPKGLTDVDRDEIGMNEEIFENRSLQAKDTLDSQLSKNDPTPSKSPQSDIQTSLDPTRLLPPLPPEKAFPTMPVVSELPGTTASPIRLSYGNGKGELVDLPGLSRGDLEHFVREEHRPDLVMVDRVKPVQEVIKPGRSLLVLGGLIRVTPLSHEHVTLVSCFLPMESHLTSTEKAIGVQTQERESGVTNIAMPGVGEKIRSAGVFQLKWDVTRQRSGPLTRSSAIGLKLEKLPFRVFATDILIEGCGWIELAVQVRARDFRIVKPEDVGGGRSVSRGDDRDQFRGREDEEVGQGMDDIYPKVEVFSPEGRFVGQRQPMNAYLLWTPDKNKMKGRPRRSMKGEKKKQKIRRRTAEGQMAMAV